MSNPVDSSVTVGWLKRTAKGSAICAALVALFRGVRRADQAIAQAAADRRPNLDADAARVRLVAEQSCVVKLIDWALTVPQTAWQSSAVARTVEPVIREIRAMELWQKVRLIGWMLAVGLLAHAISYVLVGGPISRVTLAAWAGTAVVAAAMMAWSREIAAAWMERVGRRR